jgi:glycerol-3-phosphate cytidylyltransferase
MSSEKLKKVGFTASAFDLLHAGHISMLREAKTVCDYLICGLQVDPSLDRLEKNKPVQGVTERFIQLSAVKYVDEIVPYEYEHELLDILDTYPIDLRIIGEEYRAMEFTGKDKCQIKGIEIYYNKRDHGFSTSGLRKKIVDKGV